MRTKRHVVDLLTAAQVRKDERMFLAAIKTGDGTFWELGECPRAIPKKESNRIKRERRRRKLGRGSKVKLQLGIIILSTLLKAAEITR